MHQTTARAVAICLRFSLVSVLVLAVTLIAPTRTANAVGAANDHTVLILDTTVIGGTFSREATAATAAGLSVEIVDAAGWLAKSTADFSTYRALILGDPSCGGRGTFQIAAAMATTAIWGPAVNGPVIINGTDPVFHNSLGGGSLTSGSVRFAASDRTKTGMYISLSCYYDSTAAHTAVPLLNAFSSGGFTVTGVGCYNNAHIVASHPALAGITDGSLSGWSCSVHEAFDSWPRADFDVLAIAQGFGTTFVASDGTVGTPYVLARGATVISDITLAPLTGTAPTGASYSLTATVKEGGVPTAGRTVTFNAIGGPNNGRTMTAGPTNASGHVTVSYSSALEGTDTWTATFVDSATHTQTSNRATVTWTKPVAVPHSLAVDGSTGYAQANGSKLALSGDWTVEAWFKDETPGGYDHPFAKIVAKADELISPEAPYFLVVGTNELRAGVQHDTQYLFAAFDLSGTTPNAWHHAAGSLDAATRTVTLYLDGIQVAQAILDSLTAGNDVPVSIGRGGTAGYYWNGKIDDVRIWNVVRTPSQIAAAYQSELSAAPTGLVANWKFNEASGTTAADSTASPADATLNGGAAFSADVHP